MELYPGYLQDHFNIHKLRVAIPMGMRELAERLRAFSRNRWLVLVAAMWVQSMTGVSYLFGTISPVLKASLGYDQRQVAALAVAKNLGGYVGVVAGTLSAALPAWAMLLMGAAQRRVGGAEAAGTLQPLATSGAPGRYVTSGSVGVGGGGGTMGIYERQRHLVAAGVWGDPFRPDADAVALPLPLPLAAAVPTVTVATPAPLDVDEAEEVKFGKRLLQVQQDDVSPPVEEEAPPSSDSFGHDDDARPRDKILRRLAQNREAARKSRLRKKAYIQNLETSRMKLAKLEQELTMARRQQVWTTDNSGGGGIGPPPHPPPPAAPVDPRVAVFEQEYARWVEEQSRQASELRAALQSHAPDAQLRALVDAGLAHYGALFRAKASAARSDAFFVLSGVWLRAPAQRFFLWIGGSRPSDLLDVLAPQLDPLMDHQAAQVRKLRNTARQLEDALSQGMNKLRHTLVDALLTVDVDVSPDGYAGAGYAARQMASAVGKLADLVDFVDKADHLRQQTLRNMHKILTPRQAARGLLALADYGQRLRALSSLWAARPREPA